LSNQINAFWQYSISFFNSFGCESIKDEKLEAAVLYAIQQQAYYAVSYADTIRRIIKKNQSARLGDAIAANTENEQLKAG